MRLLNCSFVFILFPILNLPSFLPPPLLCCLLLAIRLFHYPAGDGGRKIEKKKERKKERNRIKIADEIKKREHASLTRSAINRRISFCFDFHVDFFDRCEGMKGKLSLDFDPRIENYSLSLSNSRLRIKAGIFS